MNAFGDGIDWGAEARRSAGQDPPGASPGDMLNNIQAALGNVKRPRIVDAGCNIGRFCPQFAAAGFEYTGVDQSEEALRLATERQPIAKFVHSFLWGDWPKQCKPFDAALCNAVLQHNTHEEKRRILPRIAEAVRIGGVFAMQESTVLEETKTQLRHEQWIQLVEGHGFKLLSTWHPNPEYGVHDAYLFRRV